MFDLEHGNREIQENAQHDIDVPEPTQLDKRKLDVQEGESETPGLENKADNSSELQASEHPKLDIKEDHQDESKAPNELATSEHPKLDIDPRQDDENLHEISDGENKNSLENPDEKSGDARQSTREERFRHIPTEESGRWEGERGESMCLPKSDRSREILNDHGLDGIMYEDGIPDFSPLSESTVKLGYMTDSRHNSGLDGSRADKSSMSDIHMKYDKPGNFEQADILTAQQWSADGRDGHEWSPRDVAQYRADNGMTWHECNDGYTMQMIPSEINHDFAHLGGVSEIKKENRLIDEVNEQTGDGDYLTDEDYDKMSEDDLRRMENA